MRKKFLIACLSLLICFSMVFGFSTKQFANAEDINIYTLTFVSNCDEVVPAITQEEKTPLTLPTLERDGYIFLGWYSDEEMTKYFVRTAMPSESYTLYAKWHFVFNVKNAENGVTVSSSVTGENTYENFDSALSQIVNYSTTNSLETAYILFEDFNLDSANNNSSIELTNNSVKYHFSGNISSSSSNGIVNFTSENAIDLTFENFNISCSNADYAVKFETTGNTFNIGGDIVYTSKYLSHFTKENTLNSTLLNLTSKVKITTPYFTNYDVIINLKNSLSKDYIEIVSENDSYVISQNYYGQGTTQYITANSKFNVEFDTNEGGFLPAYESTYTNYIQYYSDNFSLPKSEEVLKLNSFIVGWFGKFEHDSITYYFDSQTLENFKTVNYDLNEIANYFTTDLSELINDYSFDKYAHDSSGDFKEYEHLHFFLKNGKTPTYIAKWEYNSYNISFVTNESTIDCAPISFYYGETITLPTLSKIGLTFVGWYSDANFTNKFDLKTMPARNLTVYARWDINSFYISLDLNGGQINGQATQTIYGTFGEALKTPSNPSKTGYDFIGWFSDEELTKPFEFTTMPNYNQIVYAKWEIIKLTIILDVVGGTFTSQTTFNIDYGTSIEKPIEVPKKEGYKFEYWHISYLEEEFNFYNTFTRNTVLAAKWTPVTYTLSFVTNTFQKIEPITLYYLDVIEYPTDLVYTNHKFMGWFLDAEFNTPANTVMNMQSFDMTVYAKWTPKENIVLNIPVKEFDYGDIAVYKDYSKLTGFTLYYLVNGEWSRKEPSEVGSYDIKITRDEDVDYASFEKVYSKVLVINPVKRDFSLLIFLFYFLTAIEIATIFFVKRIRKMKRSRNYSVVFGTWFISTSQFVHIIISGTIFLIFFGYLFYELLKTHRTANNENFEKSKYDTRERFKDDLEFQINAAVNPDYEYETKTKESFGDKYSAEDIEKMLINDTYNEDRLKYKNKSNNNDKFRLEEDNNTQFNINNLKNETLPDENSLNKEESKEQNSTNGYKFEEENINYEDENEKYRREMYDYDINEQFDDETKETTVLEDSSVNEESFDEDVNDTLKRQNREIEELLKEIESQNSDEENN